MLLFTIILMDLLAGVEFDLFIPSFPELQTQFLLSPVWVEASLSINFIGYCVSLFCVGLLADRYGRKPIILIGLLMFIAGSVLCLWSPFYVLLLIGRLLQGIGIAAPSILSFLIIADRYPLKQQQFFMSMLNAVMNTSVALAPIAGSFITLYFGWKGNFTALLILGCFTFLMVTFFIPSYNLPKNEEALSFKSYLPLVRSKPLLLLIAHLVLMFLPYWIFVGMSPLLYMNDLGVTLSHFGFYQGILALVFALGSLLFGFIMHRFPENNLFLIAGYAYFASLVSVLLATISNTNDPLLITLALLPFIISQIIPSNLLIPFCLNFIPDAKAKISALLQGSRLIFSALGLELASYFYTGSFYNIGIILSILILFILITHRHVTKTS